MRIYLSECFMPIKQNSSSPRTLAGLGLSPRDHGAIASAIAPLMAIFVNVAAPRPANAQCAKDNKAERSALYAPQRAVLALADGDLPPVIRLAARDGRGEPRPRRRRDAEVAGGARSAAAGADSSGAAADARADRRHRLDLQSLLSGHAGGRRRDGVGRTLRRARLDRGDPDRPARALRRRALRHELPPRLRADRERRQAAIVKINDVGPLAPGRVIDLNERAMRFFDASLERGLLARRAHHAARRQPLDAGTGRRDTSWPAPQHPAREQVAINLH